MTIHFMQIAFLLMSILLFKLYSLNINTFYHAIHNSAKTKNKNVNSFVSCIDENKSSFVRTENLAFSYDNVIQQKCNPIF